MNDFREIVQIWAIFVEVGKSFKFLEHKHKRVVWRFQIHNLFCEIFKFGDNKSNNEFRKILKCFRKTAKFEFCK